MRIINSYYPKQNIISPKLDKGGLNITPKHVNFRGAIGAMSSKYAKAQAYVDDLMKTNKSLMDNNSTVA